MRPGCFTPPEGAMNHMVARIALLESWHAHLSGLSQFSLGTSFALASFSKSSQGVVFGARTADRDAREPLPHPVRQGASSRRSLQLRPRPRSWLHASSPTTARRVARDPRRVPPLERGASPCQPSLDAAGPVSPSLPQLRCSWSGVAASRAPRRPPQHRARALRYRLPRRRPARREGR
jgi:hypothetical protein